MHLVHWHGGCVDHWRQAQLEATGRPRSGGSLPARSARGRRQRNGLGYPANEVGPLALRSLVPKSTSKAGGWPTAGAAGALAHGVDICMRISQGAVVVDFG